jgi:hypothetical protein
MIVAYGSSRDFLLPSQQRRNNGFVVEADCAMTKPDSGNDFLSTPTLDSENSLVEPFGNLFRG